ncbi:hypothetical protein U2053_14620, partial [Listeria monocytogenes]|uniref:hypothetical protein n=1 Tax=Listeria monocytogenes TaxID=1639 RepID=UPI002FDBFB08
MSTYNPYAITLTPTQTVQNWFNSYNNLTYSVPVNGVSLSLDMSGSTDMTSVLQNVLNQLSNNSSGTNTLSLGYGTILIAGTLT